MQETVTYVEMTDRAQLNPAAPVQGLLLEPLDRTSPLIPDVMSRVGAPHGWKSSRRTPDEWRAWLAANPRRAFALLTYESEPAGIVACDPHDHEVEIETFGLLPDFVGKGLGAHALTLAVRRAWELSPTATRVWLHTSSLDHPNALPNYYRRGFRTFKTEPGTRP
ncbi:GNAT family N-acetyltransferase [Actinomadura violacea]|nr:GNAT family N-acetyltransferase [Actinomadura violacea]